MATAVAAPYVPSRVRSPLVLWHLLSLDAPCVATLWTAFLAWEFHISLPLAAPLALALAVWLLYVADRLLDTARGRATEERHHFHGRYRALFGAVAATAVPMLLFLIWHLPSPLRAGWMALALPLGLYVAAVHFLEVPIAKEPVIALFFAAATTMPVFVARVPPRPLLIWAAAAFGMLCWMNCAALARWEGTLGAADACTTLLGQRLSLAALIVLVPAAALLRTGGATGVALALVTAAATMLLLNRMRGAFQRNELRALADAALLTPLAVWPVLFLLKTR